MNPARIRELTARIRQEIAPAATAPLARIRKAYTVIVGLLDAIDAETKATKKRRKPSAG